MDDSPDRRVRTTWRSCRCKHVSDWATRAMHDRTWSCSLEVISRWPRQCGTDQTLEARSSQLSCDDWRLFHRSSMDSYKNQKNNSCVQKWMTLWEHFAESTLMDSARWNVALFFPKKLIVNYGMVIIILGDLETAGNHFPVSNLRRQRRLVRRPVRKGETRIDLNYDRWETKGITWSTRYSMLDKR